MIWHYTPGCFLPAILRSGVLMPSSGGRLGELPAVWFSFRRDWDPGAGMGPLVASFLPDEELAARVLSAIETERIRRRDPVASPAERLQDPGYRAAVARAMRVRVSPNALGGLARIGVDPADAPLTWRAFVDLGGGAPEAVALQEAIDRANGCDPDEWRASLEPIPSSRWLRVERRSGRRTGERWEPATQQST